MSVRSVLAVATAATAGLLVPAAPAGAATPDPVVTIVGHGWGHGRGMGQWGAYGYVVDQGWNADMVLSHYYGGTHAGTIGRQTMTVRLLSLEGTPTKVDQWITSSVPFTVGGKPVNGGSAARLVATPTGWTLETKYKGCSADPTAWHTSLPAGDVAIQLKAAPTGPSQYLETCANQRGYAGSLRMVRDATTARTPHLVNVLPMEEYLRGVVPRESPASWADARSGWGIEALKAQAIAARSYAWSGQHATYAKTCDTTTCQVYGGAWNFNPSVNQPNALTDSRSDTAIARTVGQVRLLANNAVARTEFSASTGGYTTAGQFPAVPDTGDWRSPRHAWAVNLRASQIAAKYQLTTFTQLVVTEQSNLGIEGGRVLKLRVVGTLNGAPKTIDNISGNSFAAAFGLNSSWFFPVEQPLRQVTSVRYVRTAYSPTVYRQFSLASNNWSDHVAMTSADLLATQPQDVTTVPARYVRYSWSNTAYGVVDWATEPLDQVDVLSHDQWAAAGYPKIGVVGLIQGTSFYQYKGTLPIYAVPPDGQVHHLTPAEWKAAGYPKPVIR